MCVQQPKNKLNDEINTPGYMKDEILYEMEESSY